MDPNRLTQKSQEALHDAQTKALRFGHTEVDAEHLLLALLDQSEGIVPALLSQAGAEPDKLRAALESELSRRPRVTGPGANPGQISITQRLARLLDSAEQEAGLRRTSTSPSSTLSWPCWPRARPRWLAGCCASRG